MSRGGRGGFGGGRGGMMGGVKLPFEVDPELEGEIAGYGQEGTKEDVAKSVYPPYPGGVPRAKPPTAREKKMMQIHREMMASLHASPLYTGPKGTVDQLRGKRSAADFDAFNDQPTYGKRYEKKPFRLPDLTKYKFAAPHLFPKELWSTIGYDPSKDESEGPQKRTLGLKKGVVDKLARFDEDAEDRVVAADDDEEEAKADDDDDEPEAPQDDDFEEDEDDDNNDYNAEQYFDGGEDDYEDGGGDDYGADDGY